MRAAIMHGYKPFVLEGVQILTHLAKKIFHIPKSLKYLIFQFTN